MSDSNTGLNPNTQVQKKGLSFFTKIKIFLVVLILIGFGVVGSLIYVMVNPKSNFADFTQKYLGFNYVISNKNELVKTETPASNTPEAITNNSGSTASDGNKILNNIFGLDVDRSKQTTSKYIDAPANPSTT